MNTIKRRSNSHSTLTSGLLTVLFLILLGGVEQARAQWSSSGGNTTTTDKVGIGTSAPTQKLEVQIPNATADGLKISDAGASGKYLYMGEGSSNSGVFAPYILGNGSGPWGLLLEGSVATDSSNTPAVSVRGNVGWSALANAPIFTVATTSGSELFRVGATGNVGIGTTSPGTKLSVVGDASSTAVSLFTTGTAPGSLVNIANINAPGNAASTQWNVGQIQAKTNGTDSTGSYMAFNPINSNGTGFATGLVLSNGGNVGIGTTSPGMNLNVVGTGINLPGTTAYVNTQLIQDQTNYRGLNFGYDSSGQIGIISPVKGANAPNNLAFWTFSGSTWAERVRIDGSGNVGIGTQAPNFRLDVNRGNNSDVVLGIDANNSNTSGPMLYFRNTGTAISRIMSSTDLQFQNTNNASLLYLKTNGNVGINQTNPAYKLDVNGSTNVAGNITVTGTGAGNITASGTITGGNIQATYQDVAEWVPSTHSLPAGTVVTLNPNKSNEVTASTSAYDTRVAGVVSERPGLSLGEAGAEKVLVATTGRVKVKVDARRSPIHVGDLLVTSDQEGVAMKSEPVDLGGVKIHRPGTLIGKALEPLESGTGEILVLLSLQ